jgi:Holliday junction DNA helicase RuvB
MTDSDRLSTPARLEEDGAEASLRPQTLDDFTGQRGLRGEFARFHWVPRGRGGRRWIMCCSMARLVLGRPRLAQIVARELGVGFRATSGPVLQRAGDLAAILTNLQPRDVLFVDEIHRLQPAIEETLYPAMEDFQLDLIIGEGPAARTVRIDLPPIHA